MQNRKIRYVTESAAIAALYVALSLLSAAVGLANGPVQLRLGEALTVLPVFFPAAVPGLFVGCLCTNLLLGAPLYDILFGAAATLAGAIGTRLLRKTPRVVALIPPVAANTVCVPLVLAFVYNAEESLPFLFASVFIGESLSVYLFGLLLASRLVKIYPIE